MVNSANKTQNDVSRTQKINHIEGRKKADELGEFTKKADAFVAAHGGMVSNGTADMDNRIQQLRTQVSSNVQQVLEGEKAQSLQVQKKQIDTRDTAAKDQGSAMHNKNLQSNVNQAVVDVIGGREHEEIRVAFTEEADFHEGIKKGSAQDQQNLDNTTRQTDQAVNATLQRLKNIL